MFKGIGNLGNIASMVGAFQQLPEKLKKLNERMKQETVSATSSCSTVVVIMNGVGHVQSIKIEGEHEHDELEHAIVDATNAAGAAAKELYAGAVGEMAREMNLDLPGMDKMLSALTGSS